MSTIHQNKIIITRYNREVIEGGNQEAFDILVAPDVINHAAPPGVPNGRESMSHFLFGILHKGFSEITVEIHDQIAEDDKVTTRKSIRATHTGEFFGVPATQRRIEIRVIDILRLKNDRVAEHWGAHNLADVIQELSK